MNAHAPAPTPFAPIEPAWSGIDVRNFVPYHEARAAACSSLSLARTNWARATASTT